METEKCLNVRMENKQEHEEMIYLENPFAVFSYDGDDYENEPLFEKEQEEDGDGFQERTLCVILIDHSKLVANYMTCINNALQDFYQEILEDDGFCQRIEIALVSCNPNLGTIQQPSLIENFTMPTLVASRETNLITGLKMAVEVIEERKQFYREQGIAYRRPWIILLSNGKIDAFVLKRNLKLFLDIREESIYNKGYFIQPLAVGRYADMNFLNIIATNRAIKMKDAKLSHFFRWLSSSMARVGNMQSFADFSCEQSK